MDLYTQYAIVAAKEAIADSEMDLEKEDLNKIGVIYGVGIGGIILLKKKCWAMLRQKILSDRIQPVLHSENDC